MERELSHTHYKWVKQKCIKGGKFIVRRAALEEGVKVSETQSGTFREEIILPFFPVRPDRAVAMISLLQQQS